jgi:hypothetical protein
LCKEVVNKENVNVGITEIRMYLKCRVTSTDNRHYPLPFCIEIHFLFTGKASIGYDFLKKETLVSGTKEGNAIRSCPPCLNLSQAVCHWCSLHPSSIFPQKHLFFDTLWIAYVFSPYANGIKDISTPARKNIISHFCKFDRRELKKMQ